MTIQDKILDTLTRSLHAHRSAVAAIKALQMEKAVLESEVGELKERVRRLEIAASKAAEATLLQEELDALERLIAEFAAAPLAPPRAPGEPRSSIRT